jgi:hypothetical protein
MTADVNISANAGNSLVLNADGLYVPAASGSTFASSDTNSIDMSGAGTVASPLTADVKISAAAGNSLSVSAAGLFAAGGTTTFADTPTIDMAGAGTVGDPATAAVKLDPGVNNQVVATANGLSVPPEVQIITDATAAKTLALTDGNRYIRFTVPSAAKVLTIPTDASVPLPIGFQVAFINVGSGLLTVTPQSGVTVLIPGGLARQFLQGASGILTKISATQWDMAGAMEAA